MIELDIRRVADGMVSDLDPGDFLPGMGDLRRVGLLFGGMTSGATCVSLLVQLEDGRYALAHTSLALFLAAAQAFTAWEAEKELAGRSGGNH